MARLRLATVWLGGCSGCHMSLLDLDEYLIKLAAKVDLVYSPLVDVKTYPGHVDAVLVEGAVCTDEHLLTLRTIRERTRLLVAFGDCAVTGNVSALRNPLGPAAVVLEAAYLGGASACAAVPSAPGLLPVLRDEVTPLHTHVKVDVFLPGCPPPAARIRLVIDALIEGRNPALGAADVRFG